MANKMPKKIFIWIDKNSNEEVMLAEKDVDGCNDGQIGIYELKEVKTKSTKVVLE